MASTQSNIFGKLFVSGHKTLCCSCLNLKRFTIFSQTLQSVAVAVSILPELTSETERLPGRSVTMNMSSLLLSVGAPVSVIPQVCSQTAGAGLSSGSSTL